MIGKNDPRFVVADQAAFAAKNLYNAANCLMRQTYIFANKRILSFKQLYHQAKLLPAYEGLPRKVAQQVLKTLQQNWQSFQASQAAWCAKPQDFQGRPRVPRYLDKQAGRLLLIYTTQALSRPAYKEGRIIPSGLDILVKTRQTAIHQVRIVPKATHYVVEVIYDRAPGPAAVDAALIAGIDLGINNLATIASNKTEFVPVIVKRSSAEVDQPVL